MTKKTTAVLSKAEALLRDIEAAARGPRLRKAEAEVRDAAKPKTRAARAVALKRSEAEIAACERPDPRCCFAEMKPANWQKRAKPDAHAALVQHLRAEFTARRG